MILIIGSNGQLGREMQRKLEALELPFHACDYPEVDITNEPLLITLFDSTRPDCVINCAGYNGVDRAETDEDAAWRVNALGPQYLARLCARRGIELVHISTDYVFSGEPILQDGNPRPYIESDPCAPTTVYGRTKLAGDRFVQAECPKHYILRTAWLYGDGNNFVRTMLKLSETKDTVHVVNDQIGSPTSTDDLSEAILSLLGSGEYGLYHSTSEGYCSWYDFTVFIYRLMGIGVKVQPVTSEEFPRPAPRPKWSVLDNSRLKQIGRNVFRPWQDAARDYLDAEKARRGLQK